jgi:hypothetical protein
MPRGNGGSPVVVRSNGIQPLLPIPASRHSLVSGSEIASRFLDRRRPGLKVL